MMLPKSARSRSVDGIARRSAASAASPLAIPPRPVQPPQRLHFAAPQPQVSPRRRWWQRLLFPLAILLCLAASFVVQSLPLGLGIIALYAAVAWLRKLPSRYSFVMAFLSLLTVVVLLVVRQNVELAGNFATYTFVLLVVGIVSTLLESRGSTNKYKRSKKRL